MQLPYDVFGDPVREKARLGDELIEAKEIQLIPGQKIEINDKTIRDARYIAIVALYRQPAPNAGAMCSAPKLPKNRAEPGRARLRPDGASGRAHRHPTGHRTLCRHALPMMELTR